MSYNPYTAQRATTPPLYYRRPDGVPPSYYTVPAQESIPALSIPPYPTPRSSTTRPEERPTYDGAARPPTRPPPQANLPYPTYAPMAAGESLHSAPPTLRGPAPAPELHRPSDGARRHVGGAAEGWAYGSLPGYGRDDRGRRLSQLEAAEAALAAEEAALRARRAELLAARRQQEAEQLRLSEGWAALLEREERYYTEPVPDLTGDMADREQQCAGLRGQLQQAEDHQAHLEGQIANYEYVMREKEAVEGEIARVREGLQGVEQRRRACISRAERFFDVETKRVVEAGRAARKLDVQLKEMSSTGPLAQLQARGSTSRSQSRGVSFAVADKSVVIDLGHGGPASASVSVEPSESRQQGLTLEEESSSSTAGARPGTAACTAGHLRNTALGGPSVCIGLGDEEEMGIGGTSVAFSLNNSANDALVKRRKVELVV